VESLSDAGSTPAASTNNMNEGLLPDGWSPSLFLTHGHARLPGRQVVIYLYMLLIVVHVVGSTPLTLR